MKPERSFRNIRKNIQIKKLIFSLKNNSLWSKCKNQGQRIMIIIPKMEETANEKVPIDRVVVKKSIAAISKRTL